MGWDVGGVNTKVARVTLPLVDGRDLGGPIAGRVRPYEVQRDPSALPAVLSTLAADVGAAATDAHAVTMTAELSQFFRTKREGVAFVLDAFARAFPDADARVFSVRGDFLSLDAARSAPLAVAAANWAATARVAADVAPDALLIDIGTTTTDIIPIVGGAVRAMGSTDPARLASGELLYLGAVRTPVEAITSTVPLGHASAGVSAEAFAIAGDVHLWLGALPVEQYTMPTPDGRPATREFAGERLARVVCADRELVDDDDIDRIAAAVAESQVARTTAAVRRVLARHPSIAVAVVAGVGDFVAGAAAARAGLSVLRLADALGPPPTPAVPRPRSRWRCCSLGPLAPPPMRR